MTHSFFRASCFAISCVINPVVSGAYPICIPPSPSRHLRHLSGFPRTPDHLQRPLKETCFYHTNLIPKMNTPCSWAFSNLASPLAAAHHRLAFPTTYNPQPSSNFASPGQRHDTTPPSAVAFRLLRNEERSSLIPWL